MNRTSSLVSMALGSLLATTAFGCAVDTESAPPEEAPVGQTSQALIDWDAGGHSSTDQAGGASLGVPSSWGCVLSGVAGDFETDYDFGDADYHLPRAGVAKTPLFPWRAYGHGGTASDGTWLGNRVQARATCVPHPIVASATWSTKVDVLAAPVRIANIDSGRRACFLSEMRGDALGITNPNASARVRRILFPDAAHPTPGFYVEATGYTTGQTRRQVSASCIDFPEGTQFTSATIAGPVTTYPVGASLAGKKACGLTEIYGNFHTNSYTDGVLLKAPTTDDGAWTVTIAAEKRGTVLCAL